MGTTVKIGGVCSVVAMAMIMAAPMRAQTTNTATSTSAPAKDYEIKMTRPVKVGQKFQLTASGSDRFKQTITVGDMEPKVASHDLVFELAGVKEIAKVDDKGGFSEIELTIEKCIRIDGEKRIDVIPKGTVVTVSRSDGKQLVRAKGSKEAMSVYAGMILNMALTVKTDDIYNDKAFGTDKRQKIGEAWPVHSDVIASGYEVKLKEEEVSGQVKLIGLTKVGDIDCLDIRVVQKINASPPVANAKVEKAEMTATTTGVLPLDQSIPGLGGTMEATGLILIKSKAPDGTDVTTETKVANSVVRVETPIPK